MRPIIWIRREPGLKSKFRNYRKSIYVGHVKFWEGWMSATNAALAHAKIKIKIALSLDLPRQAAMLDLKSDSSPDVAPSLCTSAGAGSRSVSRSGRSGPAARRSYRTRAEAERQ